ncbi:MAG: EpsI family protein [Acidobacteriota bacterium]|nr:EpsI family protein [Acidobacteriota bacterium]
MKAARLVTVLLLLATTAFLLIVRGDADRVPPSEPLSNLPQTIAGWHSRDYPLDPDVLAVLGKGDFLNRVYVYQPSAGSQPSGPQPPVTLFIGYFATQRTGQSIHSPQHCLPGAGWTFESSRYTTLTAEDGVLYHVGEYVISDGTTRQFVVYWYQAHGRSIPNEYVAKFYMIADAIRMNRTDGAIVRVMTPMTGDETIESARQRAVRFTQQMSPALPRFIPN